MASYDNYIGEVLTEVGYSSRLGYLESNQMNSFHVHDNNNAWLISLGSTSYGGTLLYKVKTDARHTCNPLPNILKGKVIYETAYYFNDSRDTLNVVYRGQSSPGVYKVVVQTVKDNGQQSVKEYDVTGYMGGTKPEIPYTYEKYIFGLTADGKLCAYIHGQNKNFAVMKFLENGVSVDYLGYEGFPLLNEVIYFSDRSKTNYQIQRKIVAKDVFITVETGASQTYQINGTWNQISIYDNRVFGPEPYLQIRAYGNRGETTKRVRVSYIKNGTPGVLNFSIQMESGELDPCIPLFMDEQNNIYMVVSASLESKDIFYKISPAGVVLWRKILMNNSIRFNAAPSFFSKAIHNRTRLLFQNDYLYPQYGLLDTNTGEIFYYGNLGEASQNSQTINSRYVFPSGVSPDVSAMTYRYYANNLVQVAALETESFNRVKCERKKVSNSIGGYYL